MHGHCDDAGVSEPSVDRDGQEGVDAEEPEGRQPAHRR